MFRHISVVHHFHRPNYTLPNIDGILHRIISYHILWLFLPVVNYFTREHLQALLYTSKDFHHPDELHLYLNSLQKIAITHFLKFVYSKQYDAEFETA